MTSDRILKGYLERKKKSGYSLRALARDSGVSPAFLSKVFAGKKKLPLSLIDRIAKCLDIDAETVLELKRTSLPIELASVAAQAPGPSERWLIGSKEELVACKQWFYAAILEFTSTSSYDGTLQSIASALELSTETVEIAVREFVANGALQLEQGRYRKINAFTRHAFSKSKREIRFFHSQMLDKAKAELQKTDDEDFSRRLISGITVTASPEKIAVAKKMLSDSLHQIADFLTTDDGSEVFHLSAQLFPLTPRKKS